MVEKAKEELMETIKSEGERATLETGVIGLNPELIRKTKQKLKLQFSVLILLLELKLRVMICIRHSISQLINYLAK